MADVVGPLAGRAVVAFLRRGFKKAAAVPRHDLKHALLGDDAAGQVLKPTVF